MNLSSRARKPEHRGANAAADDMGQGRGRAYDRFFRALEEGKRCALEPEARGLDLEILIVEMLVLVVVSSGRQWVLEAAADHDNALVKTIASTCQAWDGRDASAPALSDDQASRDDTSRACGAFTGGL